MKKLYRIIFLFLLLGPFLKGEAQDYTVEGWPGNYDGVMLQGFYWDSFNETSWKRLTYQVGELSQYFDLIWVPNSAKGANSTSNGYDPVYWFTNHNSSFGTEEEIRDMINWYKKRGTGIIEDVVVNHRNGATNWWDFPAETWRGKTYHLTSGSITSTDEIWSSADPGAKSCPSSYKGAPDEGEDFDGGRDLDHTNANVQENVKAYCKFLLEDMGYIGFRYDMVKGYAGYYTGMYNLYSQPQFSVGEYFDSNYDNLARWIADTGILQKNDEMGTSAAFDFACKYQLNKAFNGDYDNLSELVWMAQGITPQPAGLIHFKYQQKAVTFVENHDTYRDGSKFTDEAHIPAANAFILSSPGTPCVFWPHYTQFKDEIQAMIRARKAAGITNTSYVEVLETNSNCYMAKIYGTRGTLVVKIGSSMASPQGFNNSQIYATGNDYCIWVDTSIGMGKMDPKKDLPMGELYLNGNFNGNDVWDPKNPLTMSKEPGHYVLKNVTLKGDGANAYFSFADRKGDWEYVNAGTRYGALQNDYPIESGATSKMNGRWENAWMVPNGVYDISIDASTWKVTVLKQGDTLEADPQPEPEPDPYGKIRTVHFFAGWDKDHYAYIYTTHELEDPTLHTEAWPGSLMTENNGWYTIEIPADTHAGSMIIFNTGNNSPDRYPADGQPGVKLDFEGDEAWYVYDPKTNSGEWFSTQPDLGNDDNGNNDDNNGDDNNGDDNKDDDGDQKDDDQKDDDTGAVSDLYMESQAPIFFNLQGIRVDNPVKGIYIKVTGNKREKVIIR